MVLKSPARQSIVPEKPQSLVYNLAWRIVFCIVFFILGFNFSFTAFFSQLPWFGYHTIVEVLISSATGLFGYFVFPIVLSLVRRWLDDLVRETVQGIVSIFWEQQSKRIQEARRVKQRKKADEESFKLKQELENALVLDTSILIDGRILDLVKIGFIDRTVVVMQNVINELQALADSKDSLKRAKGRKGLDVAKEIKKYTKVLIPEVKSKEKEVDKVLANFCKENKLKLVTLDYNLNKAVSVSGVKVLNINDLVNALKTALLPGEELTVKILQEGKDKEQGIGYLSDGTMVVVEGAKTKVGAEIKAKVVKTIQSSAGKIIFGELINA